METFDEKLDGVRASAKRVHDDAGDGMDNVKTTASAEIKNLIADVEDLVARIGDLKDADVARVRTKVLRAVEGAKVAVADGAQNLRDRAQKVASTTDDFVHDSPWQAIGIAAVVGAVVGILAARRS